MTMSETQTVRMLTVSNKLGVHARPAAKIVRISSRYPDTNVWIEKDGEQVNGKSLIGLLMLAAGKGSQIKFIAEGASANQMLDEISELFARKFDEE